MEKKEKIEGKPFEGFDILKTGTTSFGDDMNMEFKEITPAEPKAADKVEEEEEEELIEPVKKEEKKPEPKKPAAEEESDEDDEDVADEDNEDEGGKKNENEPSVYKTFAEQLAEKGILAIDPNEIEDSEEGLEQAVQATVHAGISQFVDSLPDQFKMMLEFHQAGGDLREFSKLVFEGLDWSKTDIENEDNQKLVVREALKLSGESEEDIEEMINEWSDLGTLEKRAKSSLGKLQKHQEAEKTRLIEAQKEHDRKAREQAKAEWENFKSNLYTREDIQGFKLSKKQKDDLWGFITSVDKKTGLTPLQKHNQENKDAQLLYAYLAMNNWNLDTLKKGVKTEVTSELSKKLKNITDTRTKMKGKPDSFAGEKTKNNFSAFRTALEKGI
jgi:hypothetical protein